MNICQATRPGLSFSSNGLVIDSYDENELLFVPTEIVDELPIAESWSDISHVVQENDKIRSLVSREIGGAWLKWSKAQKKAYFKNNILMNATLATQIFKDFDSAKAGQLTYYNNLSYLSEIVVRDTPCPRPNLSTVHNSYEVSLAICQVFKAWVENQKGWEIVSDLVSKNPQKGEKNIQSLFRLVGNLYCDLTGFDISFEANQGSGQSDVKVSLGTDKTIVEIKLSSNAAYLDGISYQIEKYADAERAKRMIYLYFDFGNPERLADLQTKATTLGEDSVHLVVVGAYPKPSASKIRGRKAIPNNFKA